MSRLLRGSVVSASGTAFSRVLGAVREVVLGHVFGAGSTSDAFWVAFTVPSVFRRFVADEGLTGAMIPALDKAEADGEEETVAGAVLAALLIAGLVVCAAGALAAPWLVTAFAYGFKEDPELFARTVVLTRWLFPFVVFVSLVSYCEGLLNRKGHFFVPKIAPGVVSGFIAGSALLLTSSFEEPLFALVVGVLVGGAAHLLICIPPLISLWGLPVPHFSRMRGPRFRAFMGEMGKVAAIGIFAQVNIMVLRFLASLLPPGSVTHYWYAARVVDLAQGIIAVGVSSALLPLISRNAADENWTSFRTSFAGAVSLAFVVLLPFAGLILVMAEPVVTMLFQHGAFELTDTVRTAATLRMIVPFMLALGAINIVKKAYFARDDRTPLLWVGGLGVALTAGLGFGLSRRMGVEGLGLALSISTTLQLVAYLAILRQRMGESLRLGVALRPLFGMGVATIPAAAVAWWVCTFGDWATGPGTLRNWLVFSAAGCAGMAAFVAVGLALRIAEVRSLINRFRR